MYKETILPEYGITNPKISKRINKHLLKRKCIATIFKMLETISVATIAISEAKHKIQTNMQTFAVISNRLIQTHFFSGHPLFHRFKRYGSFHQQQSRFVLNNRVLWFQLTSEYRNKTTLNFKKKLHRGR